MASVKLPAQKIILCGEYGVGKSSLFRRFANNTFTTKTDRQSTLGLDNYEKTYKVKDREIKLKLWDTGGMERVASVTSSYYKFAEAAILVFSLDNAASFHSLSDSLLDIVTYAENAKIFLCGNKMDMEKKDGTEQEPQDLVSQSDMENFCEQCSTLIISTFKTSCKTGEGIEAMFQQIANTLGESNRSRIELQTLDTNGFKVQPPEEGVENSCSC